MRKVSTFESFLQELRVYHERKNSGKPSQLILIFMANDDPKTGQSWCPDCAKAKPIIDEVMKEFKHCDVAYVLVGARDEWKRNDNPYRLHELKVTNVPTVINMRSNARLVESECFDREKLRKLLASTN
jgi:thiol-disulfide isomerase/thioredoxin